jgi:hypothetical protein
MSESDCESDIGCIHKFDGDDGIDTPIIVCRGLGGIRVKENGNHNGNNDDH